jgi:eukaryotic-like serine/threonine-protein kinase
MSALNKPRISEPASLIGQMAGEYRLLRKLGAGGFGAVYEAEHPLLKRRAAVKVLHSNLGLDSTTVQRFIEEARSASQIRHRHIVDIFSFGTLPNGQYFYVMDLLEGAPLDRYLKEHGRLEPEVALPLLRPIASALDALHAASIVHRDLKPANIFLAWDSSGEVVPKLLDFGLVKLLAHPSVHTQSGVPMGTPFYMSPEQCRGEQVDARADVYSFGVLCHELLTGAPPFTGDSATAVLVAHVMKDPPKISELCPELSPELDEPVLRMLAKVPAERPASAGVALVELEKAARLLGMTLASGPPWLPRPAVTEFEAVPVSGSASTEATGETPVSELRAASGAIARAAVARRRLTMAVIAVLAVSLGAVMLTMLRRGGTPPADAPPPAGTAVAPGPANPPPPEAPPPEPAPRPAAPEQVALTLHGPPSGAIVRHGDRIMGDAASPILLPYGVEPLELSVAAKGYETRSVTVTPNAALELRLTLEPSKRRPGRRGALPRDLESPF